MSTESNATRAAELRALGRLMRYARSQGYTYYVTSVCGATDWSWSKDGNYAVLAVPLAVGWKVTFDDGRADLWPTSVQQLTDVLVALGLLPSEYATTFTLGRCAAAADIERMPAYLGDEGWKDMENSAYEAGYERRLVSDRRKRDDFTTATIEGAYQYGYRRAAKVAINGGAR